MAGTVVLLMTDVVGSTRLWRDAPEAMNAAMARHHEIVHTAVARHGGWRPVDQGEGDSVFAAFESPPAAVEAALEIQRQLHAETWTTPRPLEVRIALHAGEVIRRGENLYGDVVNRCARIRTLASGGQVLVSASLAELVRGTLPNESELRDLGTHTLKDVDRPERVWQLTAPDLRADFPPLGGIGKAAHNLPISASTFVGRDEELRELAALLDSSRLVTVTGFGGVGKTRLALEAAGARAETVADGVWLVDLSAVRDPERVPAEVAAVLRIPEGVGGAREAVLNALRDRELLLVLDNLEQVLECAPFVADVLARSAGVRVLTTSREPLRIRGEHELALNPLPLPAARSGRIDEQWLSELTSYPAVRLFVDRASAIDASFAVTRSNATAVAEICQRLDGHALAIELAAARTKALSPEALLERLDNSLSLTSGNQGDRPERHRTLRATIAWSYDALSADEQTLLTRLSVFPGDATLPAVEAICGPALGPTPAVDVVDVLSALVDKSLVATRQPVEGETGLRYVLLVSIREFAAEQLAALGLVGDLAARHAAWFSTLVPSEYPTLAEYQDGYAAVERDIHNMRAALGFLQTFGEPANEVAFSPMYFGQLAYSGRYHECLAACRHGLERSAEPAPGRVLLRWREAWVCERLGLDVAFRMAAHGMLEEARRLPDALQWVAFGLLFSLNASATAEEARRLADEGDALLDALPDDGPYPQRYLLLAQRRVIHAMTLRYAEPDRARSAAAEMVAVAQDADLGLVARLLLARQHLDAGQPALAAPLLADALLRDRSQVKPSRLVQCAERSAELMLQLGDLDEAERHAHDAIAIAEQLGSAAAGLASTLLLADVALARGDERGIETALTEARRLALLGDDPVRGALVDWRAARVARQHGDRAAAAELTGRAWAALDGAELRHLTDVVGCLTERAALGGPEAATLAAAAEALGRGFALPFGTSSVLARLRGS